VRFSLLLAPDSWCVADCQLARAKASLVEFAGDPSYLALHRTIKATSTLFTFIMRSSATCTTNRQLPVSDNTLKMYSPSRGPVWRGLGGYRSPSSVRLLKQGIHSSLLSVGRADALAFQVNRRTRGRTHAGCRCLSQSQHETNSPMVGAQYKQADALTTAVVRQLSEVTVASRLPSIAQHPTYHGL
jgi:hypothetical protein